MIAIPYEEMENPTDVFKSNKLLIEKYYKAVLKEIAVVRLGVIFTMFEESESATAQIFDKHIKDPYGVDVAEVTLRINRQKLLRGTTYNNITTIEKGEIVVGKERKVGVVIQLDINNIPDQDSVLTADVIAYSINQAASNLKDSKLKELI